ncbi:MAG: pyridoxamine 5'-phosphate oxidase [Bdellovibrionaceae bacterium]|nr:pyridoxamine 5'-phosphate oxidase [Pseudobdellovibrionaceae bacterium]MBX3033153.1 pyridoxamine 5'-phosphate oxidase [Pseudobdellovibrionaceae bacterium]
MKFDLSADPFHHLDQLVKEAADHGVKDANAMALATLGDNDMPSVRIVLYKGRIRGGLSFYTNYEGRKGRELDHHPLASVCFFWPALERQLRVEGEVKKLTREESEAYFRTRPRLSQLGAWASRQSEKIADIEELEERLIAVEKKYENQTVPCPPHWGGFHLIPSAFEFWFGRNGRLHERYCYERRGGGWDTFMRSP